MNLREMSLQELATAAIDNCEDHTATGSARSLAISAELARRQAMLDAAEAMAKALESYRQGIPIEDSHNYFAFRERSVRAYESLAAYNQAKAAQS